MHLGGKIVAQSCSIRQIASGAADAEGRAELSFRSGGGRKAHERPLTDPISTTASKGARRERRRVGGIITTPLPARLSPGRS